MKGCGRRPGGVVGESGSPVEAFHLIRKCHASDRAGAPYRDLERVALDSRSDRDADNKRCFRVVVPRRKDEEGTTPCMLTPTLRVERQPDDMSDLRNVVLYQRSAPMASSKSAPWLFSGVIRSMRSASARDGALRT